jgi:hypothetical protein
VPNIRRILRLVCDVKRRSTAPAERSSFWRISRAAYLGAGFEGGLTGKFLVDVVDAIVLRGGVFVAVDGPEVMVGMVLYRLMRQTTIGFQRVEIEEKGKSV